MALKKILLTGFEPFDGGSINPSEEIVRQLHGSVVAGHEVVAALLPCVFGAANQELRRQLKQHGPALVICLGQAGGRAAITPERVAINIDDARIPDNAGQQPVDRPIVKGGPAAYWSTLPVKAIVRELEQRGIPAAVSQTAGTFVCNHVFYGLMHTLAASKAPVRGGLIHVPFLPCQGKKGGPAVTLAKMIEGIACAIETAVRVRRDIRATGGAEQ